MLVNYGMPPDLWIKFQKLQQMNHDYLELPARKSLVEPLDYKKVLQDTLFKWKTLTQWTNAMQSGHPDTLRNKPSFRMVLKETLADEPLCFESLYHPTIREFCLSCPFYWITGRSCGNDGSFKSAVVRPLTEGKGIFRPFTVCKLILRVRNNTPIDEVEVLKNARAK